MGGSKNEWTSSSFCVEALSSVSSIPVRRVPLPVRLDPEVHYDRAHNTWLENLFELGIPAALALFLSIGGLALTCLRGVRERHRDWAIPATGVAATVLVGVHALLDFSLQIPAVGILYACIMGVACAQSWSSRA